MSTSSLAMARQAVASLRLPTRSHLVLTPHPACSLARAVDGPSYCRGVATLRANPTRPSPSPSPIQSLLLARSQRSQHWPRHASTAPASEQDRRQQSSHSESNPPPPEEEDPEPGFRQRMRFLWKRYGWWAFGVYNLWSLVDFSLTWGVIHWFGADYIREVEARVREFIGLGERTATDEEVAKWPLGDQTPAVVGSGGVNSSHGASASASADNQVAARQAAKQLATGVSDPAAPGPAPSSSSSGFSSSLWAEAALAYTIHKTLLLPFRVMGTGAITPSFVKLMVRLGWAKPLQPLAATATAGRAATAAAKVAQTSAKEASSGAARAAKGGKSV